MGKHIVHKALWIAIAVTALAPACAWGNLQDHEQELIRRAIENGARRIEKPSSDLFQLIRKELRNNELDILNQTDPPPPPDKLETAFRGIFEVLLAPQTQFGSFVDPLTEDPPTQAAFFGKLGVHAMKRDSTAATKDLLTKKMSDALEKLAKETVNAVLDASSGGTGENGIPVVSKNNPKKTAKAASSPDLTTAARKLVALANLLGTPNIRDVKFVELDATGKPRIQWNKLIPKLSELQAFALKVVPNKPFNQDALVALAAEMLVLKDDMEKNRRNLPRGPFAGNGLGQGMPGGGLGGGTGGGQPGGGSGGGASGGGNGGGSGGGGSGGGGKPGGGNSGGQRSQQVQLPPAKMDFKFGEGIDNQFASKLVQQLQLNEFQVANGTNVGPQRRDPSSDVFAAAKLSVQDIQAYGGQRAAGVGQNYGYFLASRVEQPPPPPLSSVAGDVARTKSQARPVMPGGRLGGIPPAGNGGMPGGRYNAAAVREAAGSQSDGSPARVVASGGHRRRGATRKSHPANGLAAKYIGDDGVQRFKDDHPGVPVHRAPHS